MDAVVLNLFSILLMVLPGLINSSNNNTLLLLVSFDGFRYDYLSRGLTQNLLHVRRNSSHATYMNSVFPTKTFPNHFSIGTGLYTEVHGVLDNNVYDITLNKSLAYGYELFHYNNEVVPIWTLNERGGGGRRSGCMMWPGSDMTYQGTLPSHYHSYNQSMSWESRVDTLVSWFTHAETPVNLGMMYFEQPDLTCHRYGPDSPQIDSQIARVDHIVQYLLDKMAQVGILDKLNIIFVSDHGGQAVKVPSQIINLDNYINRTWYIRDGEAPCLQIYPVSGKEEQVLLALRKARDNGGHFITYTKEEMKDRWRYKHCRRTPPILIMADVGYLFQDQHSATSENFSVIGNHGYDPMVPTMRAIFMAIGPEFKRNYLVKPFENINIFPLAAHILSLPLPNVKPNGTLLTLQDILVRYKPEDRYPSIYIVIGVVAVVVLVLAAIGAFLCRRNIHGKDLLRQSSTASYRILSQVADERGQDLPLACEEDNVT